MTPDLRHEEWCHHWDEGKACDCLRSEALAAFAKIAPLPAVSPYDLRCPYCDAEVDDQCTYADGSRREPHEARLMAATYAVPFDFDGAPRWEANLDLTDRQTKAVAKILRRLAARPNRRPETREACLAVAEALNPRGER